MADYGLNPAPDTNEQKSVSKGGHNVEPPLSSASVAPPPSGEIVRRVPLIVRQYP